MTVYDVNVSSKHLNGSQINGQTGNLRGDRYIVTSLLGTKMSQRVQFSFFLPPPPLFFLSDTIIRPQKCMRGLPAWSRGSAIVSLPH